MQNFIKRWNHLSFLLVRLVKLIITVMNIHEFIVYFTSTGRDWLDLVWAVLSRKYWSLIHGPGILSLFVDLDYKISIVVWVIRFNWCMFDERTWKKKVLILLNSVHDLRSEANIYHVVVLFTHRPVLFRRMKLQSPGRTKSIDMLNNKTLFCHVRNAVSFASLVLCKPECFFFINIACGFIVHSRQEGLSVCDLVLT